MTGSNITAGLRETVQVCVGFSLRSLVSYALVQQSFLCQIWFLQLSPDRVIVFQQQNYKTGLGQLVTKKVSVFAWSLN